MRLVIQRVSRAQVRVDGMVVGEISTGVMVLVGLQKGDGLDQVLKAAEKLAVLRLFADDDGRTNLDLEAVGGAVLAVSQFTLAGSVKKGRRPSFDKAMPGDQAKVLFDCFVERLRELGLPVSTGVFGAMMEVELINDGPVTLIAEWN